MTYLLTYALKKAFWTTLGYSEKIQTGRLRTYFSEKTLEIFRFVTLSLEIPEKTML